MDGSFESPTQGGSVEIIGLESLLSTEHQALTLDSKFHSGSEVDLDEYNVRAPGSGGGSWSLDTSARPPDQLICSAMLCLFQDG